MKEYTFKVLADTNQARSDVLSLESEIKRIIKRISADPIKIRVEAKDLKGLDKLLSPLQNGGLAKEYEEARKKYQERFAYLKEPPLKKKDITKVINETGKRLSELSDIKKADPGKFAEQYFEEYERLKSRAIRYRQELSKLDNPAEIWQQEIDQSTKRFFKGNEEFGWRLNGSDLKIQFEADTSALEKAEENLKELEARADLADNIQIGVNGAKAKEDIKEIQSLLDGLERDVKIDVDFDASTSDFTQKITDAVQVISDSQKNINKAMEPNNQDEEPDWIKRKRELAKKRAQEQGRTYRESDAYNVKKNGGVAEVDESAQTNTAEHIQEIKKVYDELPTEEKTIKINVDGDALSGLKDINKELKSIIKNKDITIDIKLSDENLKSIINGVGEQIATGIVTESIGKASESIVEKQVEEVVEKQVEEVSKKVVEDKPKKSKKKQTKKNEEVIKTNIDKTLQYLARHAEDNQGSGYFAFDPKTIEASNIRRTKSGDKIPKQSLTKLINAYPNLNNSKSGVLMRSDPDGMVAFSNWYNEAKKRWEGDITSGWEAYKNKGFRYSGKITKKDAMLLDYSKFTDEGFEQFRKDYLKDATEAKSASIFEQLALVGVKKEEQFDYLAKELSKASGADNDALRGLMKSGLLGLSTQADFQKLSGSDSRARIVNMARTMIQGVHKGQGITDFDYDAYTKLVNDQLDYVAEQAVNVRKRNFLQSALGKGSKYTKNNWSALKYSTVEDLDKKGLSALGLKLDSATTPTTTTTTEVDVKTDKAESKTKEIKQDIESIPDKKETQITADVSDFQKKEQILHYDKNGNPMVLTNDIPTVKLEEGKAQPSRNIVDEYEAYKKKRAQEETGFVLVDSTDKPVSALDSEAEAMKRIKEAAEQAASGKQAFVDANAKVLESAHESATALGVEASAFEKLAQAAQGADKQKTEVENPPVTPEQKAKQDEEERLEKINQQRQQYFDMLAKSIQKDFATHPSAKEVSGRISGGSFHLSELESKLSEYSALKREFKELTSDSGDLGIQASIKNTGASLKAEIETIMKEGKHVPAYVENMQNLLNTTVTEIDPANFEKSAEAINKVNRALLAGNQNMISGSTGKMRDKIQKYINQNNAMDSQYRARLYGMLNSINDNSSVRHITEISGAFDNLKAEMGAAGQTGKSFWNTFTERIKTGSAQFLATYFGIQDIIRYAQQAVQAINEVDTALIELKKVSNASDFEIADALKVSEATAKDLGATVSDTVSATADWARLKYRSAT